MNKRTVKIEIPQRLLVHSSADWTYHLLRKIFDNQTLQIKSGEKTLLSVTKENDFVWHIQYEDGRKINNTTWRGSVPEVLDVITTNGRENVEFFKVF